MLNLPLPILNLLHALVVEPLSPAFLFVGQDGRIKQFGGKLAAYGIEDLEVDDSIDDRVPFLFGMLPLRGKGQFLPTVTIESGGLAADVYLFSGTDGDWVLLLDATKDRIERARKQQQDNEMSLIRERWWRKDSDGK